MKEKIKDFLNESTGYEEFKYIIQDSANYYIGAKYSYEELMMSEEVPFKLKAIIEHYISKDTDMTTTLESQLYYETAESFAIRTLTQLKAKVKIAVLEPKKKLFSKEKKYVYVEKIISLSDLCEMNLARKKGSGVIIREVIFSKLALMGFSV